MNCEITAQTCQPPFQTIKVTLKDSKVSLKCSIKTGGNVQDLTWQGLERNLRASKGLYLLQNYSTDVIHGLYKNIMMDNFRSSFYMYYE